MKISNNFIFIILPLIFLKFLSIPKLSNAKYCKRKSIEYPFCLKGEAPGSTCRSSEFELYCDDNSGLLLELPNAGNFTVVDISYYSKKIVISDPNKCLAQKLSTLDLSSTPFRQLGKKRDFRVYNCSKVVNPKLLDYKIDCLSGLNYSVVSITKQDFRNITLSNCTFLKTLHVYVPALNNSYSQLNNYSSIYLTWEDRDSWTYIPSPTYRAYPYSTSKNNLGWVAGVALAIILILICACYVVRRIINDQNLATSTTPTTTINRNDAISRLQTHTPSVATDGLDQITITSYPTVVIGESGRLIRPGDDDTCPICLTDYFPGQTLKILPECLHRFHVDCIDVWLSSKPTCPICRTFPPHNP